MAEDDEDKSWEMYHKYFGGKTWDETTEEERAKRAEEVFMWKPQDMLFRDPETGELIDAYEYAIRHPRTYFDDYLDREKQDKSYEQWKKDFEGS
jgi:hypothetical protein